LTAKAPTSNPALDALLATRPALLLDFDGVIADSEPWHYEAYALAFAAHGHRLDRAEYWARFTETGLGARDEIERFSLPVTTEEIVRAKKAQYAAWCKDARIPLFDGVVATLERLAASPFKASIASNSRADEIAAIFAANGASCPLPIVGRKDALRPKPAPDIFLAAASELGEPPAHCLVFEDARKGLVAALAAGMPTVIVRNPQNRAFAYPEAAAEIDGLAALLERL